MMDIFDVKLTTRAYKNLKKVPLQIAIKFQAWVDAVGHKGLSEVRKIPGYHDEALKGNRKGQRSVRLNIAYRAIYVIKDGVVNFVEVQEVNKHEY
jgi:proteic killer suppression protein